MFIPSINHPFQYSATLLRRCNYCYQIQRDETNTGSNTDTLDTSQWPTDSLNLNIGINFFYIDCTTFVLYDHYVYCRINGFASQVTQWVKNLPAMQETQELWVQSLGGEYPLEKGMTNHSSTFARRITRTEEPGELQSMRSQRVGHDLNNWARMHRINREIGNQNNMRQDFFAY